MLFWCDEIIKHSNRRKFGYSGYGKEFNRKGLSSFGNGFARNVVSFGVDKSSSSHAHNCKNKFFVLRGGPTNHVNGSAGAAEKKFSVDFSRAETKVCLSLHYNRENSYLFVNGKEI